MEGLGLEGREGERGRGAMRVGTQRGGKEGKQIMHLGGDTALHE